MRGTCVAESWSLELLRRKVWGVGAGKFEAGGSNAGLAAAVLAALLVAGCAEEVKQAPPLAEVEVVSVRAGPVDNVIELPGRVQAFRTAEVRARVTGIVSRRLYNEGSEVRAGQPLFAIDPRELRASLNAVQAALSRAEASAANARQDVNRTSRC